MILQDFSTSASLTTRLPSGRYLNGSSSMLLLVISVSDSLGGISNLTMEVTVNQLG
jgi:hypothetical protein